MKIRYWIWGGIAAIGAFCGALGNRVAVTAPDEIAATEFLLLLIAPPLLYVIFWAFSKLWRTAFFLHVFLALGIYGLAYATFETIFHQLNGRPLMVSAWLMIYAAEIVLVGSLAMRRLPSWIGPRVAV